MNALRSSRRYAIPAFAAMLSACSLAPSYETPSTPPSAGFKELDASGSTAASEEAARRWLPAQPADGAPRGAWWQVFGDAQLDVLETQLAGSNQNLAAAVARYQQARAIAGQTAAAIGPNLNAEASATRGSASTRAPGSDGQRSTGNDFVAGLRLSWEIDLFGRLRNARTAADQRVQASAGELAALDLSLQAELAGRYFELRGADATLVLLDEVVAAYERALDLTQRRYDGGIAPESDVNRAQTLLSDAQAQRAAVRLQRAQLEHAIAILIGQPPSALNLASAPGIVEPPQISAELPSKLLERRPDIAAAERRVAAANAEIGIARAAWFPVFTLGAAGGYEATRASDWFAAPSRFWSVGPDLVLPLFNGGALSAGNRRAQAAYEESVATYRGTVLTAYREVEDQLAALRHLADEANSNEAAAVAAQRSLFHAEKRYTSGVASYLEVTTAQTAALGARRAALDARVRRTVAGVDLVRALGGGWQTAALDAPLELAP